MRDALIQEEKEAFALEKVAAGQPTLDLFPLAKDRLPEFEAWKAARDAQSGGQK